MQRWRSQICDRQPLAGGWEIFVQHMQVRVAPSVWPMDAAPVTLALPMCAVHSRGRACLGGGGRAATGAGGASVHTGHQGARCGVPRLDGACTDRFGTRLRTALRRTPRSAERASRA
eukprot:scaffold584_cov343-Prasinococcus_capsulatus_cf.AAC.4